MAKVGGWRGGASYGNGASVGPAYAKKPMTGADAKRAKSSFSRIEQDFARQLRANPTIIAAKRQKADGIRDRGTGRAIAPTFMKLYLSGATFMGGTGRPRPNANRLLSAQTGGAGGRRG